MGQRRCKMRALGTLILGLVMLPASVVFCFLLPLERASPLSHRVELSRLRASDRARHARILQGSVGGVVDFSVQGSSDPLIVGIYFTKVKLGSPPREYNVQIDTGSDILWVACGSCTDCPQSSGLGVKIFSVLFKLCIVVYCNDGKSCNVLQIGASLFFQIQLNSFDTARSSTARVVSCSDQMCSSPIQTTATQCSQSNQCSYSFQYGDGSGTSGYYVSDMLNFDAILGESLIVNSSALISFGCSTYQSGDLTHTEKAVDGIFGFGQGDMSVISQLSSRGVTPKVFSHCLKGDANGGGILVLGEILEPGIVYSPLVPLQPHYNLDLLSIAVGQQLLQIDPAVFATGNNRGTIVDSGTTLAYLVEEALDPFVTAITAAVSQFATPIVAKGNHCYLLSSSINDVFPLVALNFAGGASMVLKAEEYLMNEGFYDGATMWCHGFQKARGGVSMLGDLVLKDKIFVYDLAHQRIGWTNYDCSTSVNVSITTGRDEFINSGQLSVSSSNKEMLFKMLPMSFTALLLHLSKFMGFKFL